MEGSVEIGKGHDRCVCMHLLWSHGSAMDKRKRGACRHDDCDCEAYEEADQSWLSTNAKRWESLFAEMDLEPRTKLIGLWLMEQHQGASSMTKGRLLREFERDLRKLMEAADDTQGKDAQDKGRVPQEDLPPQGG